MYFCQDMAVLAPVTGYRCSCLDDECSKHESLEATFAVEFSYRLDLRRLKSDACSHSGCASYEVMPAVD